MNFVVLLFLIICSGCMNPKFSPREQSSNAIVEDFRKEMVIQGLYVNGVGGAEKAGKTTQISVTFDFDELMDVKIARQVIVKAARTLLCIINSREEDSKYFEVFPVGINIVRVAVFGKTPKVDSLNFVKVVYISEGRIYYTTDSPDPKNLALITVKEESFEEACAIVAAQE